MQSLLAGVSALLCWCLCTAAWGGGKAQTLPAGRFNVELSPYYIALSPPNLNIAGLSSAGSGTSASTLQSLDRMVEFLNSFIYPGSTSTLGNVAFDYDVEAVLLVPFIAYGVTDWLSLAVSLPLYLKATTRLRRLDVGTGFIGYNGSYLDDPQNNPPLVPSWNEHAVTDTEAVRRLVDEFFEYEPLDDWQGRGIGDLILAARARVVERSAWRVAAQVSVALPTGRVDDPGNLTDWGFGDGQTDLSVGVLADLIPLHRLTLTAEVSYTIQLPDTADLRVYPFESLPLAPKTRKPGLYNVLGQQAVVDRDLGDVLYAGVRGEYLLLGWTFLYGGYAFAYRLRDSFELASDPQVDLSAMEVETSAWVHTLELGFGVDALELFRRGRFPVPAYLKAIVSKGFSNRERRAPLMVAFNTGMYF